VNVVREIAHQGESVNLAKEIYKSVKPLPDEYAREALRFIEYLRYKAQDQGEGNVMASQQSSMDRVWANEDDEVWNDVASR